METILLQKSRIKCNKRTPDIFILWPLFTLETILISEINLDRSSYVTLEDINEKAKDFFFAGLYSKAESTPFSLNNFNFCSLFADQANFLIEPF